MRRTFRILENNENQVILIFTDQYFELVRFYAHRC